jgi:hypothetical protein
MVKDDTNLLLKTYGEALTTIQPLKAVGKFQAIWISFAQYYRKFKNLHQANVIY